MPNHIATAIATGERSELIDIMVRALTPEQREQFKEAPMHRYWWDWLCWLHSDSAAPSTLDAYARDTFEFATWLQLEAGSQPRLDEVSRSHVKRYQVRLKRRGLAASTICRKLSAIRSFFSHLIQDEVIDSNPFAGVSLPKVAQKEVKWMPEEEAGRVLQACQTPLHRAIFISYYRCGLRRTELQDLPLESVDLVNSLLTISHAKNHKSRVVPFSHEVKQYLVQYLEIRPECDQQQFFLTRRGCRVCKTTLYRWLRGWLKGAGLRADQYSIHDLRHAAATNMLRNGVNVVEVQKILGHSCLETTSRYLHADTPEMREKLDRIRFEKQGARLAREAPDTGSIRRANHEPSSLRVGNFGGQRCLVLG